MCACVLVFRSFVRVTLKSATKQDATVFRKFRPEIGYNAQGDRAGRMERPVVLVADSLLTQISRRTAVGTRSLRSGVERVGPLGPGGPSWPVSRFGRSSPDLRRWWSGVDGPVAVCTAAGGSTRRGNDGRLQSSGVMPAPSAPTPNPSPVGQIPANQKRADPAVTACSCRPVAAGIGD